MSEIFGRSVKIIVIIANIFFYSDIVFIFAVLFRWDIETYKKNLRAFNGS